MYHICNLDDMDNFYRYSMKYGVSYGKNVLSTNPYLLEMYLSCNMNLAYFNDYIDIYKISNMKKYHASRISEENQISFEIEKEDIGEEFMIEISEKTTPQQNTDFVSVSNSETETDCGTVFETDSVLDYCTRNFVSNFSIFFKIPEIRFSQNCLLCSKSVEINSDLYVSKYGITCHHSCKNDKNYKKKFIKYI